MRLTRAVAVAAVLAASTAAIPLVPPTPVDANEGERFYRTGIGASGKPAVALLGEDIRSDSSTLTCASCHLGSGFGSAEGNRVAPSLRWDELSARGFNGNGLRRGYDGETLMRAIAEGIDSEGRPLAAPMPRFQLEPRDRANLSAFLRARGAAASPGVNDGSLRLAAVVTPDADPGRRRAMEAVLAYFRPHTNPRRAGGSHRLESRSANGARAPPVLGYRDWQLSIWELEGPPDSWRAQLEERYAAGPVFALLSGLGAATWQPVHRFCEERKIPCVLPNVDAPPSSGGSDWWSLYYSAGVLLEAEVMAKSIPRAARVAQVYRPGTVGAAGAARLGRLRPVLDLEPGRPVPEGMDAVVLWLTSEAALPYATRGSANVWVSATTAGAEPGLPRATVVQPFARLAEQKARRGRFDGWAAARSIERGDFRVQEQTFFACQLFAHTLSHMRDDLDRELLMELLEHTSGMELFSATYARMSFGAGQRFLSKGAYVVRGSDGDWVVP